VEEVSFAKDLPIGEPKTSRFKAWFINDGSEI